MTDNEARMACLGLAGLGAAYAARKRTKKKPLDSHGTARFATARELRIAGMLSNTSGLILGHHIDGRKVGDLVRLTAAACHLLVCSPTGGGKGVSCILPFLLTCPDSCVVLDYKGENYLRTAKLRAEKFGHRVVAFDPFHCVTDQPDSLNPLAGIPRDSRFAPDDVRDLSKALEIREDKMDGNSVHFVDRATARIKAVAAAIVWFGAEPNRSLQEVRDVLTNPDKLKVAADCMRQSEAWGGMLARMGHDLATPQGDEGASIASTAHRFLEWLDTPAMAEATKTSTFDPAELRNGKTTVYIILPPDRKDAQRGWMRMMISTLLRAVIKGGIDQENIVHFILDEFSSLGKLESITQALDIGRGYALRLQIIVQDLQQLRRAFPEDDGATCLGNTSQIFFATNSFQVAEYISKRSGRATTIVASGGSNSGGSKNWNEGPHPTHGGGSSSGTSSNWQQHGRSLIFPDEVLALPPRTAITFVAGMRPIRTHLIRYYEKGWTKRKAKPVAILWVLLAAAAMLALLH